MYPDRDVGGTAAHRGTRRCGRAWPRLVSLIWIAWRSPATRRIVSTIAMTVLSLHVLFLLPYGVLQTSGRDVAAVVTDVHWCEGVQIDCTSELRLARLPGRTDLGWSGTCLLRKPTPGDQIVVQVDQFGLFAAREKSCGFGAPWLLRFLGVLLAAAILAYVAYVFRWAFSADERE